MKKVGLIINPVAGMGGRVGLKGTDGPAIVEKAIRMGAKPEAEAKAIITLKALLPLRNQIELVTCPGAMGENAALAAGFNPRLLDIPTLQSYQRDIKPAYMRDKAPGYNTPSPLRANNIDSPSQGENTDSPSPTGEGPKTPSSAEITESPSQGENTDSPSPLRANNIDSPSLAEEGLKTPSPLRGEGRGGGDKSLNFLRSSDIRTFDLQNGEGRGGGDNPALITLTGPADTEAAAVAMAAEPVDLLLFAGGDGTARNIYNALGEHSKQTVIGIPAGVKIHSAVYATNPRSAGELARLHLESSLPLREAEVMDIDEEAFRLGSLSARLYGYLPVPCSSDLMQHLKVGGAMTEASILEAIAEQIVESLKENVTYIIGPGSTLSPIMTKLGLQNTLLGVDVVRNGKVQMADAGEQDLLRLTKGRKAAIIVTVIGGQGYIFGRGNQQISAAVIRQVGIDNIVVAATKEKILALENSRLLVDTGDEELNEQLRGYIKVVTGYREELICKVS